MTYGSSFRCLPPRVFLEAKHDRRTVKKKNSFCALEWMNEWDTCDLKLDPSEQGKTKRHVYDITQHFNQLNFDLKSSSVVKNFQRKNYRVVVTVASVGAAVSCEFKAPASAYYNQAALMCAVCRSVLGRHSTVTPIGLRDFNAIWKCENRIEAARQPTEN